MLSNSFLKELEKDGIEYKLNEDMSRHTTFNIGGNADVFVTVDSVDMLKKVLLSAQKTDTPYFIIGKGSNLLVSDCGIDGVVISLDGINSISVSDGTVTAGAGAKLSAVCKACRDIEFSGLEFAYGIPGSVGGALYMNAGAYGGEISDVVVSAMCMDHNGNITELKAYDMKLGYRTSVFKTDGLIILSATFKLKKGIGSEISNAMEDYLSRRIEKQPLEYPSAGSTFKRPQGYFAGALIEKNGLKGMKIGGAQVSEKHAGFVINCGGATQKDVSRLIEHIQKTVRENDGVVLETEVITVGRKEEILQ